MTKKLVPAMTLAKPSRASHMATSGGRSRDADLRAILRPLLLRGRARGRGLIIEEMGLCQGLARIDLAMISSRIHGFEIKSASDTLDRLQAQAATYSRVLQRVTIVADEVHVPTVRAMVPRWWGMWRVSCEQGRFQLLWRDEVIALLEQKKVLAGYRSKSRDVLWNRLIENVTLKELCRLVAQQLRSRPSWRPAHQQA